MSSRKVRKKRFTTEEVIHELFLPEYDIDSDNESTGSSDSFSSSDSYYPDNYESTRNKESLKKVNGKMKQNEVIPKNTSEDEILSQSSTCSTGNTTDPQYQISEEVREGNKLQVTKLLEISRPLESVQHTEVCDRDKHDKPENVSNEHVIEIDLDPEETYFEPIQIDEEETQLQVAPTPKKFHQCDIQQKVNSEETTINQPNQSIQSVHEQPGSESDKSPIEARHHLRHIRNILPELNQVDEPNSDSGSEDYYTIQRESPVAIPESPQNDPEIIQLPLTNFDGDKEFPDDVGWEKLELDTGPSFGPFMKSPEINIDISSPDPEIFFEALFDESMFQKIADETNNYARCQVQRNLQGLDPFQFMNQEEYQRHGRRNKWDDISCGDTRIFLAHLIIMGLVKKSRLDSYWSTGTLARTPFFGRYLSRNDFQRILWNLHCDNSYSNPLPGKFNYDTFSVGIKV